VDEVRLSTVVYAPREEVFAFLTYLVGYLAYSKHLKDVHRDCDGGPGTVYTMTFGWWKMTYRAQSEVVAIEEPDRIEWRVVKDLDARGHWQLRDVDEEADPSAAVPADREHATQIELYIEFDPDSASVGAIDVPSFVSLSWAIDRVVPLIVDEAERVLRRIVADLEGEPRDVELTVHDEPASI
jgi:uncharacterized membrane protein